MTYTRSTIRKGLGAVVVKRISDSRLLYMNFNSKATFTKSTTEGDKVTGVNSEGESVDLAVGGSEVTYELEVTSKKNTQNFDEMALNSIAVAQDNLQVPWAEVATVASGEVTLNGSATPVAATMQVTLLDSATKLTRVSGTPSAGEFKDEGDGTVTFNAAQNGKQVVIYYMIEHDGVITQGGSEHEALGDVEAFFHFISGTSSVTGKKGVSVLWMPKCSVSGEAGFEFSSDVQDKPFKLTGVIPDTPADWLVPFMMIHGIEIDNTGAG